MKRGVEMNSKATRPGRKTADRRAPKARSEWSYHVIARADRWSVKRTGAHRAARVFASRPEAVEYAVKVAAPAAAEVVVHEKDGSIAQRILPSADPVSS
jgi:hypothetical protein